MKKSKLSKYVMKIKDAIYSASSSISKAWQWFLLCMLFDLLFFLMIFFIIRPAFFSKALDYMYAVQGAISSFTIQYSAVENVGFFSLLMQSGALKHVVWFAILMLVWLAVLYFVFTFFNSLNWYFLNKKVFRRKLRLVDYSRRFYIAGVLWVLLYAAYNLMTYVFSFLFTLSRQTEDVVRPPLVFSAVFILGLYFAIISYSLLLHEKKTFKRSFIIGFKNAKVLFPLYIMVLAAYLLINIILVMLGRIDEYLVLLGGFALLFPYATMVRAVFQAAIDDMLKDNG